MAIYDHFASFYASGPYGRYSLNMAARLPAILARFGATPGAALDVACGQGQFAVALAQTGVVVSGLDQSAAMLAYARQRAAEAGVPLDLHQGDMRTLPFREQFDLVTCWYDSLNYLLTPEDLGAAFRGAAASLRPGGLYVFDMNTRRALTVEWQAQACCLQQDAPDRLEIHTNSMDYETGVASLRIICFRQEDDGRWIRDDEIHRQRGYPLTEIEALLRDAGLEVLACWGNLDDYSPPTADSNRVWFVARRP